MSELWKPFLVQLQVNDHIAVKYLDDGELISVQGVVLATDNQSSMAVMGYGEVFPHGISFSSVEAFRPLPNPGAVTQAGATANSNAGNSDPKETTKHTGMEGAKAKEETPPPPLFKKKEEPLHKLKPSVLTLNFRDDELRSLFLALDRDEKKLLGSAYNSFTTNSKYHNLDRMADAAVKMSSIIAEQYHAGYTWKESALLLCGGMLYRSKGGANNAESRCYDPNLFVNRGDVMFPEAAYFAFVMQDYLYAAAFAVIALQSAVPEIERDLLIILARSVHESKDLSAFSLVKEFLADRYDPLIAPIIQDLLADCGIRVESSMPCDKMLSTLATQYDGQAQEVDGHNMLDIVCYYLGIEPTVNDETNGLDSTGTTEDEPPVLEPPLPANIGWISSLDWNSSRGVITCGGQEYSFRYHHIEDQDLLNRVQRCYRSELEGSTCWVRFDISKSDARNIIPAESPLKAARIAADNHDYREAVNWCMLTLGSPDLPDGLSRIVEYAAIAFRRTNDEQLLRDVEQFYSQNYASFPQTAKPLSFVAQLYYALGENRKAIEYMERALTCREHTPRMLSTFLFYYVRYCQNVLNECVDEGICNRCIERATQWIELFQSDASINADDNVKKNYPLVLNCKCQAAIQLGRIQDAEQDLRLIIESPFITEDLSREVDQRRSEIDEVRGKAVDSWQQDELQEDQEDSETLTAIVESQDSDPIVAEDPRLLLLKTFEEEDPDSSEFTDLDDSDSSEIVPYDDRDGWPALNVSEKDVINYALAITGEQAVPYALTYLRAASRLNPRITPIYELFALAANDPAYAADYSTTSLFNMLVAADGNLQTIHDYCMAAAFLRTSFQAGRGYDYSAKGVRESISLLQSDTTLRAICDILEEFRSSSKMAMDIYADYRSHDAVKLNEAQAALAKTATALHYQYVESSPRDSLISVFQTKLLIFDRDGFLARLLRYVINRDRDALETNKAEFVELFLNESEQISENSISSAKIDDMIDEYWDRTGREKFGKRFSDPLQGSRRNNLRSAIKDVVKVACQWYALDEQDSGLSYRTAEGEALYGRLKPKMIALLDELHSACVTESSQSNDPQRRMGLYIMYHTAVELQRRLTGNWAFGNEKYMFVDFLKRDDVMLDEDFLPDLSSTFCALPSFNILARIQSHIEGEKPSFEDRISLIYSPDRFRCNYGFAGQIQEYYEMLGQADSLPIPENPELYLSQAAQQAQLRYRSFLEIYALAVNFGQIMQSDVFCYTLEDTVRYWYHQTKKTHNYGFFNAILRAAEEQIHISAKQYEGMLDEQLDALIANNQAEFDKNPGFEAAIREQISQQNFIVAEDWMNRIRAHDFSLVLEQPFALNLLDRFWFFYGDIYPSVCEVKQSLEQQLIAHRHGFTSEKAVQLIHTWVGADKVMDVDRITELLNLLGWSDIQVENKIPEAGEADELYFVTQNSRAINKTALPHPIAAFGSEVASSGMYVVCLYGSYTVDSLYEKIRALDKLQGNKLLLLDYAFAAAERHAIAQKLKQRESGIQNVYLLLDRVALCFLADNYSEDLVNRNLMAIGIPFSYCMPYVVSSILTMPPEIFIGRKHELSEVESPTGVNLIFGGRQLGKTALLRKARSDIDGDQGRRAILVDINERDSAATASKLSSELVHANILQPEGITDDWDKLATALLTALRNNEDIKYLLIMLDEADTFIEDCGKSNYLPIVKLKDVQQSLPGRFKFVLAGLHNIVRFNHEIAVGNNSVITHMPFLKVTPFKAPEGEELLRMPLSYLGMSLPSKVTVSQILATVNYFPGLIQLYAQKLIESLCVSDYAGYDQRRTPPYVITDDHLRRVMADKEFVGEIHAKFDATLMLDQDQGYCYYPIALLFGWMYYEDAQKAKQAGFSADDVMEHARSFNVKQIVELDKDRLSTLLSELEDLNILRSISSNTYLLASKNFRDLLGSYEEIFEKLSNIGEAQV